jgi:hypothetical protein
MAANYSTPSNNSTFGSCPQIGLQPLIQVLMIPLPPIENHKSQPSLIPIDQPGDAPGYESMPAIALRNTGMTKKPGMKMNVGSKAAE